MKRISFVLAALFSSSALFSQDSTIQSLDAVILTANKYPNKTSLTGKVVTVINAIQLERAGGKDLSQVLSEQAGIYIGGANSNAGKDKSIYLRGGQVAQTLITINGVPITDPSGIGGNFDIRNFPLADIERIEILKGGQSTLYGTDAINGVINIITRKPGPKKINGTLLASYGSQENFRATTGLNGHRGKFDYSGSITYQKTAGISEAVDRGTYPVTDRDAFRQTAFQLTTGFRPSEKLHIQPYLRYSDMEGDLDLGAFEDELDYRSSQKTWQLGIRNELTLRKTKLFLLYHYSTVNRLYINDSTSRRGFDTWSRGRYDGHEHFVDAYAHIPAGNFKITLGADLRFQSTDQLYEALPAWAPPVPLDTTTRQQSVYAAVNWNVSSFSLETGGRMNFHSAYGNRAVVNFNPSWLIDDKVKLFANISSAYRTPSVYQLYSEYGNKDLKPEVGWTAETGVQWFAGEDFNVRAVYFSRKVKDVLFFSFNPVTFASQYINQDQQQDHGWELEATWRISERHILRGFYTYINGEIQTKVSGKDTTFDNLLRRPKSSIGLHLSSQVARRFIVESHFQYHGKRKDAYYDNQIFQPVNVTLDGYTLWDVYLQYQLAKKWKIFADLRNITDTRYHEIAGFNTLRFNGSGGVRFNF